MHKRLLADYFSCLLLANYNNYFNFNLSSSQTSRKIDSLCSQFAFYQSIDQPTHYTENSASLLHIILVHNKDSLVFSGVGDPFLGQDLRYHCSVFGILKFSKPKMKSYVRNTYGIYGSMIKVTISSYE